ncbi:MAG: rRNA adenine N-6-methyltransferase family protein [Candidatus Pacearchaeota archaeon]|jgi:16S rRNA (adenine1518-N6/adenine1519-N6)-dimethyltransferase
MTEDFIEQLKINNINQDLNNLNQIFLHDKRYIRDFLKYAKLKEEDIILEIGPGMGQITKEIAKKVKKVIAVEIDTQFKPILNKMPENVDVIYGDAKKYLKDLIKNNSYAFNKIVSSPPYNLCEPLLRLLMRVEFDMVLMITPVYFYNNMNNNLIFSSFYYIKKIDTIPKTAFTPIPRIDSEIIQIEKRASFEKDKDARAFLIRSLFIQEDKKLKNALRSTLIHFYELNNKTLTKNQARDIINSLDIPEKQLEKNTQSVPLDIYEQITEKITSQI